MLALLACLIGAASAQSGWTISGISLEYVSGTLPDVVSSGVVTTAGPGDVVDTSVWHNTVTSPLVVELTFKRTATEDLSTPPSSWLKVTSAHSPSTLASAVTVSPPITFVPGDNTQLRYNLTFNKAYGAYKISFDATALVDKSNNAGAYASGVSTVGFVTVLAGFAPTASIADTAGNSLTSTWLDPSSLNTVLTIAPGSATVGFATRGVTAPTAPCPAWVDKSTYDSSTYGATCPVSNHTSTYVPAIHFASMAYTASAATYNISFGSVVNGFVDPTTYKVGAWVLPIGEGLFTRTDGVANYKTSITVKVGFRPQVSFKDTENFLGEDTSSYVTTASGATPADYWFNADLSSIELRVAPGLSAADASIPIDYAGSGSPTLLDDLLDVTPANRPGALARSGGISSSSAGGKPATGAGTDDAATLLSFPIATSGLPPGTYTFTIPAGAFKSGGATTGRVMSCATKAVLKIGFVPRVKFINRLTDADVTGSWLDGSGKLASYSVALLPNVGSSLANTTFRTADAVFNVLPTAGDSTTSPAAPSSALFSSTDGGSYSGSSLSYTLAPFCTPTSCTASPTTGGILIPVASQALNITAHALLRTDGVRSTFAYSSFKVGFTPTLYFANQFSTSSTYQYKDESGYLSPAFQPSKGAPPAGAYPFSPTVHDVSLVIQDPSGSNITSAAPATTAGGGLFEGITIPGFPSPASVFGTPVTGGNFANYSIDIEDANPGAYPFAISEGSVCTAGGICNAPSIVQLFVGFDLQSTLSTTFSTLPNAPNPLATYREEVPDGTAVEPGQWALDIAPGPGFYFADKVAATTSSGIVDLSGAFDTLGDAFNVLPSGCAVTAVAPEDAPFTYANSYGGVGSVVLSAVAGCTTTVYPPGVSSGTSLGPYGTYLLRIKPGALQRDDYAYNAVLEYPITFGFPLSIVIRDSTDATAAPSNLKEGTAYKLKLTPSSYDGTTYTALSTYTTIVGPAFDDSDEGLFADQGSTPAFPALVCEGTSCAASSAPSSGSILYDISIEDYDDDDYDGPDMYGEFPIKISAGTVNATRDGKNYVNAASFGSIKIGFTPELIFRD